MPRLARVAWAAALLLVALGPRAALAEDAGSGDSPARPFYAEAENHHPDISFGWGRVTLRWKFPQQLAYP